MSNVIIFQKFIKIFNSTTLTHNCNPYSLALFDLFVASNTSLCFAVSSATFGNLDGVSVSIDCSICTNGYAHFSL